MRFVDTNVFVRYLTFDDEDKFADCQSLFLLVENGQETLTTCESVIAEVVYVLSSSRTGYAMPRDEIVTRFIPVLSLTGLDRPQQTRLPRGTQHLRDIAGVRFRRCCCGCTHARSRHHRDRQLR